MCNFFIAFFSYQVKPHTVVEVWKGDYQSELYNVTSLGYKALLASCWYLSYIGFGDQWRKYYSCEPLDFNGKTRECLFCSLMHWYGVFFIHALRGLSLNDLLDIFCKLFFCRSLLLLSAFLTVISVQFRKF